MLSLHLPSFIFAIINIVLLSAVIIVIIKAVQHYKNHTAKINSIDKKLDKIISNLENKQ